jgi:NAD(P)H-hydrate epimerase
MRTLSREQIRIVESRAIEHYGVPEIVLMENAGRGTAELLLALKVKGPVGICCGRGNNGGDGLVIARHLDNRGVPVLILQVGEPQTPAAKTNFQIASRSGLPVSLFELSSPLGERLASLLDEAEWIVDALFGTGLRGRLKPPFDEIVTAINQSQRRVLAVDIPSGLDCDLGIPEGSCVRADHTATFIAVKKGFDAPQATDWLGKVHVIEIGAPRCCLEELDGS